jgi:hypothetical protein
MTKKEIAKLQISSTIFGISFLIVLLGGLMLSFEIYTIAVPLLFLGVIGSVIGIFSLIACYVEWWERRE